MPTWAPGSASTDAALAAMSSRLTAETAPFPAGLSDDVVLAHHVREEVEVKVVAQERPVHPHWP